MSLLQVVHEGKESKDEFKMPGAQMFNTSDENLTTDEVIYQPFPGFSNPDRWALLSCYEEAKGSGCFVKIHGLFPHRKLAENVGKAAMEQGYKTTCVVADTRSWLRFPINEVEKEVHVNEALKKAVGLEIEKNNSELERLRKRVKDSRGTSPTTAYGRYLQLVSESARELLASLDDDEKAAVNLREKFEEFRKKEIAQIENPPLDPVLAQHFKNRIKKESLQDKTMARQMHGGAGMGMPNILKN